MFVILTGSSGVGKNTVIKELLNQTDNLVMMPTFTTRQKRDGEVEGSPYFFVSKQEFQNKIKNGEFLEHENIHNNFYGTSQQVFEDYLKSGKIVIKDVDVNGAQNLAVKLAGKTDVVKIFLTTTQRTLRKRLRGRNEKQIKLRLKRYKFEQKQKNKFDFIIFNNDLQKTVDLIKCVFQNNQQNYVLCKRSSAINSYLVKYYANKLLCGKTLKPAKICVHNNKIYVAGGVERFVAGIIANKTVAKVFLSKTPSRISKFENTACDVLNQN